jgi:hypothetical protein
MGSPETRDKLIAGSYGLAREHVMRGGELPQLAEAVLAAADPEKPAPNPELRNRAIAELEAMFAHDREQLEQDKADRIANSGKMAAAGPDA